MVRQHPSSLVLGLNQVLVPELDDCHFLSRLTYVWNADVERRLLDALKNNKLKGFCVETVLNLLLQQKSTGAEEFARSLLAESTDMEMGILGAVALLRHSPQAGQTLVLARMKESASFGRRVIEKIGHFGSEFAFIRAWGDNRIGDLFVLVARYYPESSKDHEADADSSTIGTAQGIRYFKSSLLTYLRNRGSKDSVAALEKAREIIGADWIKWHIADAKLSGLWNSWRPLTPDGLFHVVQPRPLQGQRWQEYALSALVGYVINLVTSASVGPLAKVFLIIAAMSGILALLERLHTDKPLLAPFWLIIFCSDLLVFLIYSLLK